jgi:hypothetical protein
VPSRGDEVCVEVCGQVALADCKLPVGAETLPGLWLGYPANRCGGFGNKRQASQGCRSRDWHRNSRRLHALPLTRSGVAESRSDTPAS